MPGPAIAIGIMNGLSELTKDLIVGNNLEYVDGSNILLVDGAFLLQAQS